MILKRKYYFFIVSLFFLLPSCEGPLEEETFTQLGPSNFYETAEDAEALLNSVYANARGYRDVLRDYLTFGEMTTDLMISRQGAINANTQPIEDFLFPEDHPWLLSLWAKFYSSIFRANTVLEQVPNIDMDETRRTQIVAEARFLRVFSYYTLHDLFGTVPLILTSETTASDRPSRATREEFDTFMITEFTEVATILPPTQEQYGRATRGAALGLLAKYHLNQKSWQEAADTALEVMDLGVYGIFAQGNRAELFALANQRSNEFIWVFPFPDVPTGDLGNTYLSHAAPPGYQFEFPPKVNFAAQFKLLSSFVDSFAGEDERLDAILFEYTNGGGNLVQLGNDDKRSFKYREDPNGIGDVSGNDFPILRYADILMSRAEALNELQGPNQESIELINQIRTAAGLEAISLADFASKEALRDQILLERSWEFHTEGLRRQDLIRHGKFIQLAQSRGKAAQDYQVLFPLPQTEIDKNPNLEQNPGY
ncbi:RagB/SusD family nutrient uptake outer membrane protein [Flagellimonas sp. HMM57]|uniref:RagB/SusD family nutrient uptake outer membrane protein n=1 Tax=unclassified Flagellimonas TaxID=2644544 RepID=UPI0013D089ED|nr:MULTISPECIES: RagB/SusD family nutrient uptake outer membrane protein [unclassified Flagellimonas]UII75401.1 RagB/SusD family nutrient uptake outer membrane protein [Flagellimonas sp. HMM57]